MGTISVEDFRRCNTIHRPNRITRHRHPSRILMSFSPMADSPRSSLMDNLLSLLDTVFATRRVTSFWNTYKMANTKKARLANPPRPRTEALMRERSDLLRSNAYSVSLDDFSTSPLPVVLRKIRFTAGINAALRLR
jgi:hypothetical protein